MKGIILLFVLLTTCDSVFSQSLNWQKASGWTMYDSPARSETFKWDSLSIYRATKMNEDTMRYYFSNVSPILMAGSQGAAWMGYYRITCRLGDTTRPLLVSNYGGFFEDLLSGKYYEIPVPDRQSWLDYLNQQFGAIARSGDRL